MTLQTTRITPDWLADAVLDRTLNKGTGDPAIINRVLPYMGALIDVVDGYHRMSDLVTIANVADVKARFIDWLLDNGQYMEKFDSFLQQLVAFGVYRQLVAELRQIADNERTVTPLWNEESTPIWLARIGVSYDALDLYYAGELTFEKLLQLSPDVFIPSV